MLFSPTANRLVDSVWALVRVAKTHSTLPSSVTVKIIFLLTISDPESSPSDQHNLEVEMHENSLTSPRQLNMADSTLQEGYEADESNLQDVSVIQETPDTRDDPQEHSDQQTSPKEVTCEPLQKVEPHHNINEANSEPHLTEDNANLQREDPPEISVTEDEAACPTGIVVISGDSNY